MKKVVFLDVDGVICLADGEFDAAACRQLVRLMRETEAELVISSTWRLLDSSVECLLEHLATLGLQSTNETPFFDDEVARYAATDNAMIRDHEPAAVTRAYEMLHWLHARREVSRWVALDDLDLPIGPHLVMTTFDHGLTAAHVDQAIRMLERPTPSLAELLCRFEPPA